MAAGRNNNDKKQSTRTTTGGGRVGAVGSPHDRESPAFTYQTYVAEFGEPITVLRGIDADDIMSRDEEGLQRQLDGDEKSISAHTPLRSQSPRLLGDSFSSSLGHPSSTSPSSHQHHTLSPLTMLWHSSTTTPNNNLAATEVTPLFWGGRMVLSQQKPGDTTATSWRVGLLDCFHQGLCHRTIWTSLCCPTLALGRILNRLDLDWLGNERNNPNNKQTSTTTAGVPKSVPKHTRSHSDTTAAFASSSFYRQEIYRSPFAAEDEIALSHCFDPSSSQSLPTVRRNTGGGVTAFTQVFVLTCLFWTFLVIVLPPLPIPVQDPDTGVILALYFPNRNNSGIATFSLYMQWLICGLLVAAFGLYMVVILTRLRQYIQNSQEIQPSNGFFKDFWISMCCACCSLTQMARHTGVSDDEEEEQGGRGPCGDYYCSSPTGLWLRKPTTTPNHRNNNHDSSVPSRHHHHSNPKSTLFTGQYHSHTAALSVTSLLQSASRHYYQTIGSSRERGFVPPPPSIRHLQWSSMNNTAHNGTAASTGSLRTTTATNIDKIPPPAPTNFSGIHRGHPL